MEELENNPIKHDTVFNDKDIKPATDKTSPFVVITTLLALSFLLAGVLLGVFISGYFFCFACASIICFVLAVNKNNDNNYRKAMAFEKEIKEKKEIKAEQELEKEKEKEKKKNPNIQNVNTIQLGRKENNIPKKSNENDEKKDSKNKESTHIDNNSSKTGKEEYDNGKTREQERNK